MSRFVVASSLVTALVEFGRLNEDSPEPAGKSRHLRTASDPKKSQSAKLGSLCVSCLDSCPRLAPKVTGGLGKPAKGEKRRREDSAGSHSLHYFYLRLLEPSQELPPSFIRGYLNDPPIIRFDSLTGRALPLMPWMEEVEKETFLPLKWVFRSELEKLSRQNHSTDDKSVPLRLGNELALRENDQNPAGTEHSRLQCPFVTWLQWKERDPDAAGKPVFCCKATLPSCGTSWEVHKHQPNRG